MGSTKVIQRLEIFGELPRRFKCQLCRKIMQEPIQTLRGESACEECYTKAKGNSPVCPIDQEPINDKQMYFKDKAKEREIMNLQTHCLNKPNGCDWKGNIREFIRHSEECLYKGEDCNNCHNNITGKVEVEHFENCTKLSRNGKCLFSDVGCKQKDMNNGDLTHHVNKDFNFHLYLMMGNILSLSKANEVLEASNKAKDAKINQLEDTVHKLTSTVESITKNFNEKFAEMKNQLDTVSLAKSTQSDSGITAGCNFSKRERQIIEDVDLRLQLHENTTYDGNLIWKIDNYQRRRAEAISGTVKALHSAPCFTSLYGYKYCLRLYLNGDGVGRNQYISLFLVIMKSEYDNILEWPFTKKVKFTLINQLDQTQSIVERMVPNKDSSSFQKPSKEMNIASGCPRFYELSKVETSGFLKNDSIFIQVKIE